MSGAPKGGRVHTVLFYLRLKPHWRLQIGKIGHNYAFVYIYPMTVRAVILVTRTSARCFRITVWDKEEKTIHYTSATTAHKCAVKINKIMATTPKMAVSIEENTKKQ